MVRADFACTLYKVSEALDLGIRFNRPSSLLVKRGTVDRICFSRGALSNTGSCPTRAPYGKCCKQKYQGTVSEGGSGSKPLLLIADCSSSQLPYPRCFIQDVRVQFPRTHALCVLPNASSCVSQQRHVALSSPTLIGPRPQILSLDLWQGPVDLWEGPVDLWEGMLQVDMAEANKATWPWGFESTNYPDIPPATPH